MPAGPSDLVADTVLKPDPEVRGRYHADIPDHWKVMYVFGGVTMYAALRAMREALARPELRLVTANAIFVAPVPPGPVTIDVEVLRDGRTASQMAADLRVDGKLALRVHGVFGIAHDLDHGFAVTGFGNRRFHNPERRLGEHLHRSFSQENSAVARHVASLG